MSRNVTSTAKIGPLTLRGSGYGLFILGIIAAPVMLALWCGLTMLFFGIVHTFWPAVPALSFWQTAGVIVLVQLLTYRSTDSK